MIKYYRFFHLLSLDIVLGALASSLLAARMFSANPGWVWWLSLALTVWIIYMGSHMAEAWKQRKKVSREVHSFIIKNRQPIVWVMALLIMVDSLLIFNFLDTTLLKAALGLGGGGLLFYAVRYIFKRRQSNMIPGELFVLFFYLLGTWMGPFLTRNVEPGTSHLLILIMMIGVLILNLGLISLYDPQSSTRLGLSSLSAVLGKKRTRNLMIGIVVCVFLLAILQFLVNGTGRISQFSLIISGMSLLYLLMLMAPSLFRKQGLYRLTAEAILWMGFLSLLIGSVPVQ